MLRDLFLKQRKLLDAFFGQVDVAAAEKVLEKLLACSGVIILSGVGKSGHIAQKISTTLLSTGTRSVFLSPAHALHGDIGFVTSQDIFLSFSKSGESEELLDLLPHVRQKGAYTIAVVSQEGSRLAKGSDLSMYLPVTDELCPFGLAPTFSTTAQLIFGDCLAMALMQAKGFTVERFAENHPAGLLGRRISLKVADLMLKGEEIPVACPTDSILEKLPELSGKKCGCLLICNREKELLGIFTDGDLRRAIQTHGLNALQTPLEQVMTLNPRTVQPDRLALHAMEQMEAKPRSVMVLPVLEQGKVIGLLRMHDIIQRVSTK